MRKVWRVGLLQLWPTTKALGDKLASGVAWTREEVAKGFEALGNAINALGQKIGSSKKAALVNVGS